MSNDQQPRRRGATRVERQNEQWRLIVNDETRGHYRDAKVMAEHFLLAIQEIDTLRDELKAARHPAGESDPREPINEAIDPRHPLNDLIDPREPLNG